MQESFCNYLRSERETRQISLGDVSRTTKIPIRSLELLEAGAYESLPGEVFVRGFIRSYARYVGVDDEDAVLMYDAEREEARAAEAAAEAASHEVFEAEVGAPSLRRRVGIAVFVAIVLIIATITLSLLLRGQGHTDDGLSQAESISEVAAPRCG